MNYENIAQPWQTTAQQQIVLPVKGNSRFFYKHHPKNWELCYFDVEVKAGKGTKTIQKPVWLPALHTHTETPGVNGCRGYTANPDSSHTRTRLTDKGWTIIPPAEHDYLRKYPARKGSFWADIFTKIENIGGDLVQTFNHKKFQEWRLSLMVDNIIKLPHKTFLQRKMIDVKRQIERHTRNQHIPEIAAKLNGLQKIYNDMNTAMQDVVKNGEKHYEL
tara:strand:- start:5526 stop:6179 length:654 start_codon:yes stop_codon:yes gene_type:complete